MKAGCRSWLRECQRGSRRARSPIAAAARRGWQGQPGQLWRRAGRAPCRGPWSGDHLSPAAAAGVHIASIPAVLSFTPATVALVISSIMYISQVADTANASGAMMEVAWRTAMQLEAVLLGSEHCGRVMQAWSAPVSTPMLQTVEGVPCASGLLDGPAALTALLLCQAARSKAAAAAVQVGVRCPRECNAVACMHRRPQFASHACCSGSKRRLQ